MTIVEPKIYGNHVENCSLLWNFKGSLFIFFRMFLKVASISSLNPPEYIFIMKSTVFAAGPSKMKEQLENDEFAKPTGFMPMYIILHFLKAHLINSLPSRVMSSLTNSLFSNFIILLLSVRTKPRDQESCFLFRKCIKAVLETQ